MGYGIWIGNRLFFNILILLFLYDFVCDDFFKICYEKICNDKNIWIFCDFDNLERFYF